MCMYCERRTDIKFGWEQPKLPYHSNNLNKGRLNGNVLENEKWGRCYSRLSNCYSRINSHLSWLF